MLIESRYTPDTYQSPNITGLSPLVVPDNDLFPKRILYPVEYLPLNNSAAEVVLQQFIKNMSSLFNMTVEKFNFTATVQNATDVRVNNLTYLSSGPLGVINAYTQWSVVAKPLITKWRPSSTARLDQVQRNHQQWCHVSKRTAGQEPRRGVV
jgi:hypothetical protein